MKKIISGLVAIAILAQSITALAAVGTGEVATTAAESGGTQLISDGDFSSNISSKFSTKLSKHSVEWVSSDGFLHIGGTADAADYLMYDIDDITLQPGKYVFSFKVRHGQENESLPGDYDSANGNSLNNYREFSSEMNLLYYTNAMKKSIFGGDLYETCGFPYFDHDSYVAFGDPETHKYDPNGKMVFDEGTEYAHDKCLTHIKYLARAGSEWRTVKKTFIINSAVTLKDIKIHTSDSKAVNMMSYDIDDLSLMYYSGVTSAVTEPNYDLDPVEGVAIKTGTANIDGKLDPAYLSSLNINMMSANASEWARGWNNTASARTYYLYDSNYIYLFASVMDDDVIKPKADIMAGDVLLWNINAGYSPILNNDLFIWRLSLNGTPDLLKVAVDAYGSRVFGVENASGVVIGNSGYSTTDYQKIHYAAVQTDSGYQIEVRVPRKLGSVTTAASKLGITLELRDLSSSGETGSEYFAKDGETYNFPVFFNLSSESASGDGYLYGSNISGVCSDNVSWTLSNDGVLTVSGFGAIPNYASADYVPWNTFMAQIKKIVIEPGVTSICSYAFEGAVNATSAEIADSVSYIGKAAFKNCSSLSSIAFNGVESEWDAIAKESTWKDGAGACNVTFKAEASSSASGICGDLSWSVANGTLSISGTGEMSDFTYGGAPWSDHATNIKSIEIGNGATSIGDYAFAICNGVESISIPASVTSIGKYAFAGCAKLENINLSAGLTAIGDGVFANCYELTGITIPGAVTSIGEGAFSGCGKLEAITVESANANYVSDNGVLYTKNMANLIHYPAGKTDASFTVPAGVTAIANDAFKNASHLKSVVVSGGVTSIGSGAFSGCAALTSATISGAVSAIADDTFAYCAKLEKVALPASVTAIGENAFISCRNLTEIDLSNVNTIGEKAFFGCGLPADYKNPLGDTFDFGTGLTSVTLSGNLTSIGSQAFANCNNLTDIYFGADRASWNKVSKGILWDAYCDYTLHIAGAVNGTCGNGVKWEYSDGILTISGTGAMPNYKAGVGSAYYVENSNKYGETADIENWTPWYGYINDIKSVVIGSGVTSIGDYAFKDCTALESVTMTDSVIYIGKFAFNGCTSLTSVSGMTAIDTLGKGAFKGCSALTSMNIPGTLDVISMDAFSDCTSLETVTLDVGVREIGDYAFYNCRALNALSLPSGFENIGNRAFYGCKNIQAVDFPVSLRSIDEYAFKGCEALATIDYAGTTSLWANVSTNNLWDYGAGWGTDAGTYTQYYAESSSVIASGSCGTNVIWKLDSNYTLTISGNGAMYAYTDEDTAPWYSYRKDILAVVIESSVTGISKYAFFGCISLTDIDIADSVTTIDQEAFVGCSGLKEINIPSSVLDLGKYPFKSVANLESINVATGNKNYKSVDGVLFDSTEKKLCRYPSGKSGSTYAVPDGVTEIGQQAFLGCTKLTSVTLPSTLTKILNYAFDTCYRLTDITIPASVTNFGNKVFAGCDALTSIKVDASNNNYTAEDGVLYNKNKTTLVEYPAGKPDANFVIPDGVTTINARAFKGQEALKTVTIPSSVTSIKAYAFSGCTNLDVIRFTGTEAQWKTLVASAGNLWDENVEPYTVKYGLYFGECGENLEWAISKDGVLTVSGTGAMIDFATAANAPWYSYCSSIKTVVIEAGVTSIGGNAFNGYGITSITVPASVTAIADTALCGCNNLTAITVDEANTVYVDVDGVLFTEDKETLVKYPASKVGTEYSISDGVTVVGDYAFENSANLTAVTIPASVTAIGDYAFAGSTKITTINYAGVEREWNNITKGENWDNGTGSATASEKYTLVTESNTDIATGTLGENFEWFITSDGTFTITGEGDIGNFGSTTAPWAENRDTVKAVIIGEGVTAVGDYAFVNFRSIESVTIGADVTSISKRAFMNCDKLASIEVDEENETFASSNGILYSKDVTSLILYPAGKTDTTLEIPASVTTIISYAVRSAKNLESVIIPDNVTTIGNYAFWGSSNIKTVTIGSGVSAIGSWAFAYCDGITSISVAEGNTKYKSVDGVLYTEDMTTLVSYPVGNDATGFEVPNSVKRISNYAFYRCDSLTEITLPASVTIIGNNVFNYCDNLTAITVDASNAMYASKDGVLYSKDMTSMIYYPAGKTDTEFTVPETVIIIGKSVFENCDNLETVKVGTNVIRIGYAAFAYCDELVNISYAGTEAEWDAVVKGNYWNRYLDGDEVKFGA